MARILHQNVWYEQISSESLYEEEYERILRLNGHIIFPKHKLVKFNNTVLSEEGSAKADFALIDLEYRGWWVVEVELAHHPFEGHVRPQVEILANAEYGDIIAENLCANEPSLDLGRMKSVIRGQQPRVVVIVNAPVPKWVSELRRYDAIVTILEIFRSRHNLHIFRLNGEAPINGEGIRSLCKVELSRFIRVLSPGILPVANGGKMNVFFRDGISEWTRLDTQDRVYVVSSKPIVLNRKCQYELTQLDSSTYVFRELD